MMMDSGNIERTSFYNNCMLFLNVDLGRRTREHRSQNVGKIELISVLLYIRQKKGRNLIYIHVTTNKICCNFANIK